MKNQFSLWRSYAPSLPTPIIMKYGRYPAYPSNIKAILLDQSNSDVPSISLHLINHLIMKLITLSTLVAMLCATHPVMALGPVYSHASDEVDIAFPFVDIIEQESILSSFMTPDIYVDIDASGSDDGSSWMNAYNDLQDAIDAASAGDEIWVAEGTYNPTKDATGNSSPASNRDKTFYIDKGIKIYGGFFGNESGLSDRDKQSYETILNGDLDNDDAANLSGVDLKDNNSREDNSYHVISLHNVGTDLILDGLTISGGNSSQPGGLGGGILNEANGSNAVSSPIIKSCIIINNSATHAGGGLSCFVDINSETSNPTIIDTRFENNYASEGGGLSCAASEGTSNPKIDRCVFKNNSADRAAAAQFVGGGPGAESRPLISNSLFVSNKARFFGGAIRMFMSAGANNSLVGHISGCTFTENEVTQSIGSVLYVSDLASEVTVSNCIIYNNIHPSGEQSIQTGNSGTINLKNTLLESMACPSGVTCLSGMLFDEDPLFNDVAGEDFSLKSNSQAINAGDNASIPSGITSDIIGNDRIDDTDVDMGAYEFRVSKPFITRWDLKKKKKYMEVII